MSGLLLREGLVMGPRDERISDVRIEGGVIAAVGGGLAAHPEDRELDCSGCWVGPGFVDLHAHLREPGHEYKEDIASGSVAAAAGGFTAVVAMPNTDPPLDTAALVRFVRDRGQAAGLVDVRVAATLTRDRAGEKPSPFDELFDAGVRVFTDDGDTVADAALLTGIMFELAARDGLVSQHAVDPQLAAGGHLRAGPTADRLGIDAIPAEAEEVAMRRDLELVHRTGCRYHIQHLSTAAGVELVATAKEVGLPVTAEVSPHHLAFDMSTLDTANGNYKVMPPLGTTEDRDALRRGLLAGIIDAVATDHAPHAPHEKEGPLEDAAFGVLGLADAAPVVHTTVDPGPRSLFNVMAVTPAEIGQIDGHGSWIEPGVPANLAVFDPAVESAPTKTFSKSRNSPYRGRTRRGGVRYTIFRGELTRTAETLGSS